MQATVRASTLHAATCPGLSKSSGPKVAALAMPTETPCAGAPRCFADGVAPAISSALPDGARTRAFMPWAVVRGTNGDVSCQNSFHGQARELHRRCDATSDLSNFATARRGRARNGSVPPRWDGPTSLVPERAWTGAQLYAHFSGGVCVGARPRRIASKRSGPW